MEVEVSLGVGVIVDVGVVDGVGVTVGVAVGGRTVIVTWLLADGWTPSLTVKVKTYVPAVEGVKVVEALDGSEH